MTQRRFPIKNRIPSQPGAWVMALLPTLSAILIYNCTTQSLLLLIAWTLCYCIQFTASRWLASHFARRYLPPVITYSVLFIVAGIPSVILNPSILYWVPLYMTFAAISFTAAWLRKERSLWANAVAVSASSCMAVVISPDAWIAAIAFALAQFGSVLFVKTMIRERGKLSYIYASIGWHAALLAIACAVTALYARIAWLWILVATWLLIRATAMPLIARRRTIRPMITGFVEMISSIAIFIAILAVAPWLALG